MDVDKPEWGTPEWHRQHPIFGTDFSKPPQKLIEELRSKISNIRGQLGDIGKGYPGFGEAIDNVEGLLTCGLVTLYGIMQDMEKCFEKIKTDKNKCPTCHVEKTCRDDKGFLRCPKCGEPSP